jgi:hypothetical protein
MCIEIRSQLAQCPHHIVTTIVYCALSWQFTNIACAPDLRQIVVSDDRTEGWCHACSQTAIFTGRTDGFEPFDLADLAGIDILMGLVDAAGPAGPAGGPGPERAGQGETVVHELDSGTGADLNTPRESESVTSGSSGGEEGFLDAEGDDLMDGEDDDSTW